ncbi:hypothetical protein B9Z55_013882 [Caenorhabditis nigoni]|uniref:Uncharacterized protein n=1 Tax=Caenorhabditis nigoni TaxID=1611254 RepID=A0A2G5U4H3_9PELO|nr:hypothetical protein B9Z55_013882 [Caenorhabditis nigoni]
MRVIFVFLLLIVVLTTADSYDDVKAKIKDLIDDGYGKYNRGKPSSGKKSVSDQDDYGQGRKKKVAWDSEDDYEDDDEYDSYGGNKYDNQKYINRMSKDQDESSNYRSRSSGSESNPDSRPSSSSQSDSSVGDKNHYKNGKRKGIIGKFMDKVATKLKSIPGKVAAGAAALTGKVVSGVASVPGKVVDGVKSIPSAAKSIIPGGKKKESGDITLNDYTQDSSEQENHFHLHKDKHYHEEEHRHQDYNTELNVYNDWDGYDLDDKYGSVYDNMRFKRSVQKSVNKNGQLRKKPSKKRAIVVF